MRPVTGDGLSSSTLNKCPVPPTEHRLALVSRSHLLRLTRYLDHEEYGQNLP